PNYSSAIAYDKQGKEVKRFQGTENHYGNFIKAVRSRKHTDLHADILEGHLSSALCHIANISYQLGKPANSDEIRRKLKGNDSMAETFGRMLEHLKLNEVDVAKKGLILGEHLKMNPRTERFSSNAANKLLSRNYRKGFAVPQKV
ncbi:MAG: gfo/Idh/MocA family oxidoreductase, partial [Limisphaerales bacterium]